MKKETRNIIISICGIFVLFGLFGVYSCNRGELKEKEGLRITQDQILPSEDEMTKHILDENFDPQYRLALTYALHKRRLFPNLQSTPYQAYQEACDNYDTNVRNRAKELCKKVVDDFLLKNPNIVYPGWNCPYCKERGWLLVNGNTIYVYKCSNGHLWER